MTFTIETLHLQWMRPIASSYARAKGTTSEGRSTIFNNLRFESQYIWLESPCLHCLQATLQKESEKRARAENPSNIATHVHDSSDDNDDSDPDYLPSPAASQGNNGLPSSSQQVLRPLTLRSFFPHFGAPQFWQCQNASISAFCHGAVHCCPEPAELIRQQYARLLLNSVFPRSLSCVQLSVHTCLDQAFWDVAD